jgi:hypothetical protein
VQRPKGIRVLLPVACIFSVPFGFLISICTIGSSLLSCYPGLCWQWKMWIYWSLQCIIFCVDELLVWGHARLYCFREVLVSHDASLMDPVVVWSKPTLQVVRVNLAFLSMICAWFFLRVWSLGKCYQPLWAGFLSAPGSRKCWCAVPNSLFMRQIMWFNHIYGRIVCLNSSAGTMLWCSFRVEFCYGVSRVLRRYYLRFSLISTVNFYYVINKLIILILGLH